MSTKHTPNKCKCGGLIKPAYGYRVFQRHAGENGHIFDEHIWWTSVGRQDVLNRLLENGIKSTEYKTVEVEEKPMTRHFSCDLNSCEHGREDFKYNYKTRKYEWRA